MGGVAGMRHRLGQRRMALVPGSWKDSIQSVSLIRLAEKVHLQHHIRIRVELNSKDKRSRLSSPTNSAAKVGNNSVIK